MKVVEKDINDIIPYANNPRNNDSAVEYVANSIREFGFKVPCVIDKNNVLVCGHTRVKAAKELGIGKIPCVIADDLTDEQIKAFRLADNKVSEQASWDFDLLDDELDGLFSIDMEQFGFSLELPDYDDGEKENERERTMDAYNLDDFDREACEGYYQMPTLKPCDVIPDDIISFNYMLTSNEYDKGIHFYIDDYQFERVWNEPRKYINKMQAFRCAFTPDFSLYREMPMAMKIWNVYRSRMIGQMMQRERMDVIPTVSWCEKETFDWCFDGLPKHSTLSISTIGVKKEDIAFDIWRAGVDAMIAKCEPKALLIYGGAVDYDFGDIKTVYYNNHTTDRMRDSKHD